MAPPPMQVTDEAVKWPLGFVRIPAEPWVTAQVDGFADSYDCLQHDSWYANLEPTVEAVAPWLNDGACVVDYSGGTGILLHRLLQARPAARAGMVNVDASAKFLRKAVETLGSDSRCAFRHLAFLRDEGRLRTLAEVAEPLVGKVDGIACANAFHLYPDSLSVAKSWFAMLRPGGQLHIQSGNLTHNTGGAWIIDDTVAAVQREARRIVAQDPAFAHHQLTIDGGRRSAYEAVCRRYFPATRSAEYCTNVLESAGFTVNDVQHRRIRVETTEWARFLGIYHEGVLPWVGGCKEVDGRAPDALAVQERLALIGEGLRTAVGGPAFHASWTYVNASRAG